MKIQNLFHVLRTHGSSLSKNSKFCFFEYYERVTGNIMDDLNRAKCIKKNPKLETITESKIHSILQVLNKFQIFEEEAVLHPHLFSMNPITLDNYGMVLQECGFLEIKPIHVIRYHTVVRSRNIAYLKKNGCLPAQVKLTDKLLECFNHWPDSNVVERSESEDLLSILQTRLKILQQYLNWRLGVTEQEFLKYCKNYLVIKHRPFADIQEAVKIAQFDLQFTVDNIRRHGFVISADPTNTKLILEHVPHIAGVDVRQILRIMPAIIKNNYAAINRIREILEEFRIPNEVQRRSLPVYCMCPETVLNRLTELSGLDEFKALTSNPRVLALVVHKNKMMRRLARLKASNKQCFSLDSLVASKKTFDVYANKFGDNIGGRDVACMIYGELRNQVDELMDPDFQISRKSKKIGTSGHSITEIASPIVTRGVRAVTNQLCRHAYWRHATTTKVAHNMAFLRKIFDDEDVYLNCHLLFYPMKDIVSIIDELQELRSKWRSGVRQSHEQLPPTIDYKALSDRQLLALALYTIEKQHHFSGDGIWGSTEKLQTSCAL